MTSASGAPSELPLARTPVLQDSGTVPGCFTISGFELTEELGIVGDCVEFWPLSSYRDHHSSFCEVTRVVFGWLRTLQVEQTHLGF
ncbi:MAG TPA: hypothetical protein VG206_01385 [Terriglobia bacterium]|nr:hypothetical protein [Terriglobia bacterium]